MLSSVASEIPAHLLSSIYEASTEPARWPVVTDAIARWVGGAIPSLQARRLGPSPQTIFITSGVPDNFYQSYVSHYAIHDPHLTHVARLDVGRTLLSREVIPDPEYLASTFYNEWCRPQRLRDLQGAVLLRNAQWAVTFAVFGHDDAPLDEATRARLDAIVPHLTRALRLGFHFDERIAGDATLHAVAQAKLVGWLKVDGSLTVLDHNDWPCECSLSSLTTAVTIRAGKLFAANSENQERLKATVRRAIEGQPGTMALRDSPRALRLVAVPGPRVTPFSEERAATLVFSLPEQHEDPRLEDLPPSLRKVASALERGLTDKDIASELGLTLSTARTYVARIMARLDVRDRRALIRR